MFAHISIYMKVNKNRRPFLHIRKNWRSNIGNSILQRSIYICNVRIEIDFCLSFEFFYARGNVLKFCKMSCQKFEIIRCALQSLMKSQWKFIKFSAIISNYTKYWLKSNDWTVVLFCVAEQIIWKTKNVRAFFARQIAKKTR